MSLLIVLLASMGYCLPKFAADEFKKRVVDRKLNPNDLARLSSAERRAVFGQFMNEMNAKNTNALFESKLILKNQQKGLVEWARTVSGLKPEARRDMIRKVERLDKVLDGEELDTFLEDLVQKRLGVDVSEQEAKTIATLARKIEETKTYDANFQFASESDRINHGASLVAFENFVNDLKLQANKVSVKDVIDTARKAPINAPGAALEYVSEIGGIAKSIKGSLDNSLLGRQAWPVLFSEPRIWAENAARSYGTIVKQLGKKGTDNAVIDAIKAEIYSRPNSLNGNYTKAKLAIGSIEEAFPTSLPSKVPLLGRAFKASETAFNGTAYRLRADLFDTKLKWLANAGVDVTEEGILKSLGQYTNSLTGRGDIGAGEAVAKSLNNLFFSPKFVKSRYDFLVAHASNPNMDPRLKAMAARDLVRAVATTAGFLYLADAVQPGSVQFDPRSSDSGKIRIGDTRIEILGGHSALVSMVARLLSGTSMNSKGEIIKLDDPEEYKGPTSMSTIGNFIENKFAPLPNTLIDLRRGEDKFTGVPMNLNTPEGLSNTAIDLFAPLPATNARELLDNPNAAPFVWGILLDFHGFGTNTY